MGRSETESFGGADLVPFTFFVSGLRPGHEKSAGRLI
jgi:hypothetical protein